MNHSASCVCSVPPTNWAISAFYDGISCVQIQCGNAPSRTITRIWVGHDVDSPSSRWPGNEHPGNAAFRQFMGNLYRTGFLNTPAFLSITLDHGRFRLMNQHGEMLPGTPEFVAPSSPAPGVFDLHRAPCKILLAYGYERC